MTMAVLRRLEWDLALITADIHLIICFYKISWTSMVFLHITTNTVPEVEIILLTNSLSF